MEAFLDTEWADRAGSQLVSLALVSADRQQVFYAEVDALPDSPTEFVRDQVYPRLRRGSWAMARTTFARALYDFVLETGVSKVFCDHPVDERFFVSLLKDVGESGCPPVRPNVHALSDPVLRLLIEDYFAAHAEVSAERHNALVDAQVLAAAWEARVGRADASWSPSTAHFKLR